MKDNTTKNNIQAIAINLFKEHGYTAVTINEICRLSGISKHTFYYYFESKEQLIDELTYNLLTISNQEMIELFLIDSPYVQFKSFMESKAKHFISFGKEIGKIVLDVSLTESFDQDNLDNRFSLVEYLIKLIEKAQKEEAISNKSASIDLVRGSLAMLIGMAQIWVTDESRTDELFLNQYLQLLDILLNG